MKMATSVQEEFLHYLWQWKRFNFTNLQTTNGETIEVLQMGTLNRNAGPDFTHAKIRIGDTLWAGNVEIHIYASDWVKHRHQVDQAYNNVILHVVLEEDQKIFRASGVQIPCLELKGRIPPKLSKVYKKLLYHNLGMPCQSLFATVPRITKNLWLDRLMVERLETKTRWINQLLQRSQNHWEETFYQVLARTFGLKVNAQPFELLAQSLPLNTLSKHKNNLFQIEALLFGQAGLLNKPFIDEYPNRLKKEFLFLQKKYALSPLKGEIWKFMRMRPANFPTIRIAQWASLIYQSVHLLSKALAAQNVSELENMFEVKLSNYWHIHYIFDKASLKRRKSLGQSTIHLLIINAIVPFLFFYGMQKGAPQYKERAISFLEALKPEKNSIISEWNSIGFKASSASQTQALLQLKSNYCDQKKCLQCAIGNAILK